MGEKSIGGILLLVVVVVVAVLLANWISPKLKVA